MTIVELEFQKVHWKLHVGFVGLGDVNWLDWCWI